MTTISLHEDSFSSWHTCPEDSKYNKSINGSIKYSKTNNENILKDLNLNLDNSDDESIVEFEKIVDQSEAFNKFKENTYNEDFLRPLTPSSSIRRENDSSVYPSYVRPKYLSDQQNLKKESNLLNVPKVNNNISPINQTSSITLIDTDNQEYDITMPGGSLAIFEDSKDNIKNDIQNVKESIKDKKDDLKDSIEDTKEKVSDIDEPNENQGTLGRLFSYFRGFGRTDNNVSTNNEVKPLTDNKNKTLIETVETIDKPNNSYINTPALLPTESVVTVVNNSEENYDEEEEEDFVNAFDEAPNNIIDYKQNDYPSTKMITIVTPNNPTDISINDNEAVVEEKVVIQNPDGSKTTTKKVIYTVDENGNENLVQNMVYNNDANLTQDQLYNNNTIKASKYNANNNQDYHNPNVIYNDNEVDNQNKIYNNQVNNTNGVLDNKIISTIPNETVEEDNQSITSSEDFVDAVTAASNNNINNINNINNDDNDNSGNNDNIVNNVNNDDNHHHHHHEEVQRPHNLPPKSLSFREGTVKKIQHSVLEKTSSSLTLKSTTSLNVELVPVNKPHETVDITTTRPNYFGYYEDGNSTMTSKPPRKAHRKKQKQKKRKWYHKIFKFSICTRNEDY
ncbi:hypothetical protein PIROE2DRAFT_7461 [Piromyces sp. E2]|nr:hypothetical protein PIROE2DRAFT_7461 [Piromyces sp. E2]|eukprot:OUM65529.1 hypothetical protein PIROE2DRAFT_7461 [Piromyces sp. E2]